MVKPTVEGDAVQANLNGDEVGDGLRERVAALGSLALGALVLNGLAGGGALDQVLGGSSRGHDGEGDKGDDVLELHFGWWGWFGENGWLFVLLLDGGC